MKKFFSIILCVLWMVLIYYNSSQDGTSSNGFTYKITDKLITISEQIQIENNNDIKVYSSPNKVINSLANKDRVSLNKVLRKSAHVMEFLILSMLLCNAFFTYGIKGRNPIIYVLFITLFYAVLDEYHQIFVIGRGSSVKDVLIDFIGGIIGMAIYYIVYYLSHRIRKVRKT